MYQKRNPIIFIALFFLVVSCSTETKRVKVDTNTTIRVQSETFTSNPDNYNFNWIPPSLEQGSYHYDIKDNIMLFTPLAPGNYDIALVVTGMTNETIHEETFFYTSVGDKIFTPVAQKHINSVNSTPPNLTSEAESVQEVHNETASSNEPEPQKKDLWTVQVLSKPSYLDAERYVNTVLQKGFSAWIDKPWLNPKDGTEYFRVCIGSTSEKDAYRIKDEISRVLNIKDTWVRPLK